MIRFDSNTENPANFPSHPSTAASAATSVPLRIPAWQITAETSGDTTRILLSIGTSFLESAVLNPIMSLATVEVLIEAIVITWLEWAVKYASNIVIIEVSTAVSIPSIKSFILSPEIL